MDAHLVRSFGFMLAEQARIFGMQALNDARKAVGESPAYTETDFLASANIIEQIAREING